MTMERFTVLHKIYMEQGMHHFYSLVSNLTLLQCASVVMLID